MMADVSSRIRDHVFRRATAVLVLATAVALAGCGGGSSGSRAASPSGSGQLTVLAAASLTGSFTKLGQAFESAHPGTKVVFSFGASSTLATQITSGAPADVFASASTKNMDAAVAAGAAVDPKPFARNAMEIAVPPANPAGIARLSDLARPGVKVVLCAAEVPCGSAARKVFGNARLDVRPVSDEADVKATLSKVILGEADAGVVYVTDVLAAAGKVKGIAIPADVNASTSYPIAALSRSKDASLARAFVAYVLSADAAAILADTGFEKP
jgi:molybdate transport system substrate-binding protein